MSNSDESSFEGLPLELIRQIDSIARRAERLWRQGDHSPIEDFLAEVPDEGRAVLLEELQCLKSEARRNHSEALIDTKSSTEAPSTQRYPDIPGYEIVGLLGRGAMGIVYLARQQSLQRLVAVKVMASGIDLRQAQAVIRAEAEAIARLRHPNIVQVFEIGEIDNEPFLSIEYVMGQSLRELLYHGPLAPRQAAELIEQVARAIHHAHANGIIHRDLKPANILLQQGTDSAESTRHDALSLQKMTPKVTDFGLAKVVDAMHVQTHFGALLGTPKYMSPEQAEGRNRDIGPTTDVYALGAILYEMLTGIAPFESDSSLRLLQLISDREPHFPAKQSQRIPVDLQAICLRCLEKSQTNRYGTASELADDLQRFLNGFPVIARRQTRADHVVKFVRRNPVLSAAVGMMLATFVIASVSITIFAFRESSARRRAENYAANIDALRRNEQQQVYWANLRLAHQAWQGARIDHMRQYLEKSIPTDPLAEDLRGFEWHYLWKLANPPRLVLKGHYNPSNVAFSPDGALIASPDPKGNIRIIAASSGELQVTLPGKGHTQDVVFSPDGKLIAIANRDKRVILWDLLARTVLRELNGHNYALRSIVFSPDGKRLISADEVEKVIAWSIDEGTQLWSFSQPELYTMDLSYDHAGRRIAVGCGRGRVRIVDAANGTVLQSIEAHSQWLTGVAFSPSDLQLATSSEDRTAKIWNLTDSTLAVELAGHKDCLTGIAYSSDGQTIGTASRDGTVKLWDAENGRPLTKLVGHSNWVTHLCFSPDNQHVASVSIDGTACIWTPDPAWEVRTIAKRTAAVTCLAYDGQGKKIVVGDASGKVVISNVATGALQREFQAHTIYITDIELSPNGELLATAGHDNTIKLWDVESGDELRVLQGHDQYVRSLAIGPDNRRLYSASRDGTLREWDMSTGAEIRRLTSRSPQIAMALSPDGSLLASSSSRSIQLWNTETWTKITDLTSHTHVISSLAFSRDGRILASGGSDRGICLWDVASKALTLQLIGHANVVTGLSFNQSGGRLVSSSQDHTLRIWDTTSGHELLTLDHHQGWINGVTFGPMDKNIATCSHDQTVKIIE